MIPPLEQDSRAVPQAELREIAIPPLNLKGLLGVPVGARGLVLFAHGSGSSRFSSRNQYVAAALREDRLATLLFDLLDEEEGADRRRVFDIPLLADRLTMATEWVAAQVDLADLPFGYFGASTGAAAALAAAARPGNPVAAVVSRGGRPDLAGSALSRVRCPTLLIVGARDHTVIQLNEAVLPVLRCKKKLSIVPGATHLFEEAGTLEQVVSLARRWFARHLSGSGEV